MTLTLRDIEKLNCKLNPNLPNTRQPAKPNAGLSLDELSSALEFIPSDVPRGDGSIFDSGGVVEGYWFGVLLAARRGFGDDAEPILRDWSRTSSRFTDEGFVSAWRQFDPNHPRPVTVHSLFRLAELNGWRRSAPKSAYKLLDREAIMGLKPIEWRVKGIFPKEGVGAIYGPSGSGKSFLAIDLGLRVAAGENWFGRKTEACPVTYVMLEGEAGIRNRVVAWETANNDNISDNFCAITQPLALTEPQNVEDLAAAIPHHGIVMIDTLNRAAPGMDENSSKDMGELLNGMKKLQSLIGGLVLMVHHTGKDASKGMRGHSSLHAALDGAIEVKRDSSGRQWSAAKVKDGADDAAVPFKLEIVELGMDEDGEFVSSCVAMPDYDRVTTRRDPSGAQQLVAMQVLRSAGPDGLPRREAVTRVAALLADVPPRRRKNRATEVIDSLGHRNFVTFTDDDFVVVV